MTSGNNRHLCLKLADKSLYSLYKPGETGTKELVITPASREQRKNNISLYECTGPGDILLRDILVENSGDMTLSFSLGQDFLSYRISGDGGEPLEKGLIELSGEDEFPHPSGAAGSAARPQIREKRKTSRRRGLLLLSVILSLAVLLLGAYYLVDRSNRTVLPPLTPSEMTPR